MIVSQSSPAVLNTPVVVVVVVVVGGLLVDVCVFFLTFCSLSLPPVTDHELRGSVGGPGVRAGQGAVQRTQPGNSVRMYRRHRGLSARWIPAVLALPCPLRQDGCSTLP